MLEQGNTRPDGLSEEVTTPEARGAVDVFEDREVRMTENGPRDSKATYRAGKPGRVRSALAEIEARSRAKGPLFTPSQHAVAEAFEALSAKVHGGQVKCSDLEASGGGAGAQTVTQAMIDTIRDWRAMLAVTDGVVVLRPRGVAAQEGRRTIWARAMVTAVLEEGRGIGDVLDAHGWSPNTRNQRAVVACLGQCLDDMAGVHTRD